MPTLCDCDKSETEDKEDKVQKIAQIATYTASPADDPKRFRRQLTPRITVDFHELSKDLRQLVIDVMTLVHLLSGKQQVCRIPDPLSRRRLVVDEVSFAKLEIVLQQISEILRAVLVKMGTPRQVARSTRAYLVVSEMRLRLLPRVSDSRDARDHFGIDANYKGVPNVREAIKTAFDFSPLAPPLGEQIRNCHRSYQNQ